MYTLHHKAVNPYSGSVIKDESFSLPTMKSVVNKANSIRDNDQVNNHEFRIDFEGIPNSLLTDDLNGKLGL